MHWALRNTAIERPKIIEYFQNNKKYHKILYNFFLNIGIFCWELVTDTKDLYKLGDPGGWWQMWNLINPYISYQWEPLIIMGIAKLLLKSEFRHIIRSFNDEYCF